MPLTIHVTQDTLFETRVDLLLEDSLTEAKNIRVHNTLSAFFYRLFGNILDVRDKNGKLYHINKSDFLEFKARNNIDVNQYDKAMIIANNQSFVENVLKNFKKPSELKSSNPIEKKTVDKDKLELAIKKLNDLSSEEVTQMKQLADLTPRAHKDFSTIDKVVAKLRDLKNNPLPIPIDENFFADCDPNLESLDFINSFRT